MKHLHLLIHGIVQGVGFRYFALERARRYALTGEVRNRPDGTVEIDAEGTPEALAAFLKAMGRGPSGATVREIEETWSDGTLGHREFRITA